MTPAGKKPIIIAHRGASALRPEHTLAAYRLAIEQGADFIEPDLVSTRDGELVARHENEITTTTNVAALTEFAGRRTVKNIDGAVISGWFTEDFTLAELKQLRARERIASIRPANTAYNDIYAIPTLQEIIDLAQAMSRHTGRDIGIYPETKHPGYFQRIGLPLESRLVQTLHDNGYRDAHAPVFIQSFEVANLRTLREMTRLRLVQLIDDHGGPADVIETADVVERRDAGSYLHMASAAGLLEIAGYADAIGPNKNLVIPRDGFDHLNTPTQLVLWAHDAGLVVHPWTFRPENVFLPADLRRGPAEADMGDSAAEIGRFLATGIDGFFTDLPVAAIAAVQLWYERK